MDYDRSRNFKRIKSLNMRWFSSFCRLLRGFESLLGVLVDMMLLSEPMLDALVDDVANFALLQLHQG